jgi:DNA polymerase-3 subunit epsilon
MLLRDASFVVVDVETTGLSAHNHRITEIGMVRVEKGSIVDTYQTLLNPEQFISPFITQHTGITNAMVFGKPTFREALPEIRSFITKKDSFVFTGHNVKFDLGFVTESFTRCKEDLILSSTSGAQHLLCTCRLARRMLPSLRSKSLSNVQAHFGIKNVRQHRAMGDAEATAKVLAKFIEMAQESGIEQLEDLLRLQYAKPNYSRRTTKREVSLREKVSAFPKRPGVYIMKNASGTVLYVGKAKNLHDRVGSYFSRGNTEGTKLAQLMRTARDISYEETGSELSALLLESKKIKEFNPKFNTVDRWYKFQSFIKLDVQKDFPTLSYCREPVQDGAEYFGPFNSREATEGLIEILNRAFTLRECGEKFRIGPEEKPCFYYDIKRCKAPCALLQTKEEYRAEVDRLQKFLAAGDEGILALVEEMMQNAAEKLNFEEAQFLKIRWMELQRVLGRGEREWASVSSNDFVIFVPIRSAASKGSGGSCEVFFVRFGRLMKQMVLGPQHLDIAEQWFSRQLRLYYGATSAIPPTAGKPEVDEMRVLTRWVEIAKRKGSGVVYMPDHAEQSVELLVEELRKIVKPELAVQAGAAAAPVIEEPQKRLKLKPMKAV